MVYEQYQVSLLCHHPNDRDLVTFDTASRRGSGVEDNNAKIVIYFDSTRGNKI